MLSLLVDLARWNARRWLVDGGAVRDEMIVDPSVAGPGASNPVSLLPHAVRGPWNVRRAALIAAHQNDRARIEPVSRNCFRRIPIRRGAPIDTAGRIHHQELMRRQRRCSASRVRVPTLRRPTACRGSTAGYRSIVNARKGRETSVTAGAVNCKPGTAEVGRRVLEALAAKHDVSSNVKLVLGLE